MKVLILGGDGMLGHQLLLSMRENFDVRVTLRLDGTTYSNFPIFNSSNSYYGVDVRNEEDLLNVFNDYKPDVLINAIGLVKQRTTASEALPNLEINSLLPHRLAHICEKFHTRLIHISTDCVFSGKKGNYSEQDTSDAEDYYGRTKYLGEVNYVNCLTLRTSFIGLELARNTSLLEWFLAQKGEIKGFCHAIYSGLTTLEMANVINVILTKYASLSGVWHVSSEPISKYDLLMRLKKLLHRTDIEIKPETTFKCDRSLQGSAFEKAIAYKIPDWNKMLQKLVEQINQRDAEQMRLKCSA